jgi:hypothetical protein
VDVEVTPPPVFVLPHHSLSHLPLPLAFGFS